MSPATMAQKGPIGDRSPPVAGSMMVISRARTTKNMAMRKSPAAMKVTLRRAAPGSVRSRNFMAAMPITEHNRPTSTVIKGSATASAVLTTRAADVAPIAMVATIEPTYDSKMSAPIPATSPTLSPTLSAIVAGLRGSSSGDAGLDLAHEIRAHIGRLREDAPAHAGEERDRRGTHGEAGDDFGEAGKFIRARHGVGRQHRVQRPDAEETESRHRETHHRAPEKGDAQRLPLAILVGRGGGTHVGPGGSLHAEEAGQHAARGPGHVGERGGLADREEQEHGDHSHEYGQHRVLAPEKRHRPVVDLVRQFGHHIRAARLPHDVTVHEERGAQSEDSRRPRPVGKVQ